MVLASILEPKIHKKSIKIRTGFSIVFLYALWMDSGWNLNLCFELFLVSKAIGNEKGAHMKKYTPYKRNHDLSRSGVCFLKPKSMKHRLRKWNEFWNAFLKDFESILGGILEPKSFDG